MIEPVRHDWPKIIGEICEALRDKSRKNSTGRGKLAELMHRQVLEIQRWEKGGKMEHYEGEMLLIIRASVCPSEAAHREESPTISQTSQRPESGQRDKAAGLVTL